MKLIINPEGGMAGDMFSAALISAGAPFEPLQEAMAAAGNELGTAQIERKEAPDGAVQLSIQLDSTRHHLAGKEARAILSKLYHRFNVQKKYRDFGDKILTILIKAEIRAHAEYNIVVSGDHSHSHTHHHTHEGEHDHSHSHAHGHPHNHSHNHSRNHSRNHSHDHSHDHSSQKNYEQPHPHSHPHHHDHEGGEPAAHGDQQGHQHMHQHEEEAFLHEAQDIVIDIMGAVIGMQALDILPEAQLTGPISVGGGHVKCSHGTLSIPAPATTIILDQYQLEWQKGPVEKELFTPTGAAIMAALGGKVNPRLLLESLNPKATGIARGTRLLDIPSLKFYLVEG